MQVFPVYRWAAAIMTLGALSGCAGLEPSLLAADAAVSLQKAVDRLPATGGTIRLSPGVYRGKLFVTKPNVRLIGTGASPQDVVIVSGDSAATAGSIYASAATYVSGDGFRASNLTFANDWDADPAHGASQAVALAVTGDRAVFDHVRVLGGQDTLYLAHLPGRMSRQLFRDCYVEGHVDFVFGNAAAYFDRCRIHGKDHNTVMYTAQSRNVKSEGGGFVFANSVFTAGRAPDGVYIGRPWRHYARVVLIDSRFETPVAPTGWREWKPGLTNDGGTVTYAEYRTTYADGAPARSRIRQLGEAEARRWTLANFFGGDIAWTQ
jgi:pectinesterase